MWHELFIEYNGPSLLCEFLTFYTEATKQNLVRVMKLKNETQKKLNLPEMPFLIINSKDIVKGEVDICRQIAKLTGSYEIFFGRTKEEEVKHLEFIHEFNRNAEYIPFLNNHLSTRTFCNGNHISISDLYAFAFVIQEVLSLSDDKKWKYCNVIRWTDHLQNLNGLKSQLERLKFIVHLPFEPLLLEPRNLNLEEKKKPSKPEPKEIEEVKVDKKEVVVEKKHEGK